MPGSENAGIAEPIVRVGGCSEAEATAAIETTSETSIPRPMATRLKRM